MILTLDGMANDLYLALHDDKTLLCGQFINSAVLNGSEILQLIHLMLQRCRLTVDNLTTIQVTNATTDVSFYCRVIAEGIAAARAIPVTFIEWEKTAAATPTEGEGSSPCVNASPFAP